MKNIGKNLAIALSAVALSSCAEEKKPNIIFILADDMGYGDVSALNPDSKILTPHIDGMAQNGVLFTDAHTSSAVSTPTRYGFLTGRYNWRSTLKSDVVSGYSRPIIDSTRTTVASMLKRGGYTTACVGKWHLGWNWNFTEEPTNINELSANGKGVIDFSTPITGGPTSLGFDYFYGFSGSLDMPPYVYVENDKVTSLPNRETFDGGKYTWWRKGPTGGDFDHEQCLPNLTDKAIAFIKREAQSDKPFFLYVPYPGPHTPILPTKEWQGKSGLNPYGDFTMMVDSEVGRILSALKESGIDENTMVVFTTDNGCSPAAKIDELIADGHYPNHIYRGHKADLFEGGHRVPCVVKWSGSKVGASSQTICLTDFFATFAQIAGVEISDNEGEDSYSILTAIEDPALSTPIREATVHHSINGSFAIRVGDWKLLTVPSSGGWSAPSPNSKDVDWDAMPPMQLYNLKDDPSETTNLYAQQPERVEQMKDLLVKYIEQGRSTEGKPQKNDGEYPWRQIKPLLD